MLIFTKAGFVYVLLKAFWMVSYLVCLFMVHSRVGLSVPLNPLHVYTFRFVGNITCVGKVNRMTIPES
jgi:hypothetical protein